MCVCVCVFVCACVCVCVCSLYYACVRSTSVLMLLLLLVQFAQSRPREHVCSHWCSLYAIISLRTGRCRNVEFALACVREFSHLFLGLLFVWHGCVCVCSMHVVDVWCVKRTVTVCARSVYSLPIEFFVFSLLPLLRRLRYFSWQYVSRAATIETSFSFEASVQLFRRTFRLCPVCKITTHIQLQSAFLFRFFDDFIISLQIFNSIISTNTYGKYNLNRNQKRKFLTKKMNKFL